MPFNWDIIDIKKHMEKDGWIRMWNYYIYMMFSFQWEQWFISLPLHPDQPWISHLILLNVSIPWVPFSWIKLPDHESDYATLFDSEVMISWAVLSLLRSSLCMVLIRHTYISSTFIFMELDFRYIRKIVESDC